jgi:hypothetical protein
MVKTVSHKRLAGQRWPRPVWAAFVAASQGAALAAVALACTSPPVIPPDGTLPANQTAAQVLLEAQTAGCVIDGGLAGLEREHASVSRPASVDCLFAIGSTVAVCGCP